MAIPDFVLDCSKQDSAPIMFVDGNQTTSVYAESLESLLFNAAFNKYRLPQFPWEAFYSSSFDEVGRRDLSDILPNVVRECGLNPLWFSDQVSCCAESTDVGICLTQHQGQGVGARVAAIDRRQVSRIGSILSYRLGTRHSKWVNRSNTTWWTKAFWH